MVDFAKLGEQRKNMSDKEMQGHEEDFSDVEGFEEKRGSGKMYFRVFDRSICMTKTAVVDNVDGTMDPPPAGWEEKPIETTNPRNKEKKWTYVKRFDRLIARIINVRRDKKQFEGGGRVTNWNFELVAKDKRAVLQLSQSKNGLDPVLSRVLKVAPNIDFTKPIAISAFGTSKDGKTKQAVSFRQPGAVMSRNVDDWEKVEEYWKRPTAENGQPLNKPAKGADGSVLPQPIHDEDDNTWDYKPQEKFLIKYFGEVVVPRIKKAGAKYAEPEAQQSAPEGGSGTDFNYGENKEIPVITEKPENPVAQSLDDTMLSKQSIRIKRLAKHMGKDPEKLAQKILGCEYGELSQQAASYLTYRIEKQIAKLVGEGDLEPFVEQESAPAKKKSAPKDEDDFDEVEDTDEAPSVTRLVKAKEAQDDEDDDDGWGTAPAPKAKAAAAGSEDDDDDDEEPF
jgi:hypothetical protein